MAGKQPQLLLQGGGGGGRHVVAGDYADSLAPGYRFCPTDLELIVYYLMPKIEKQIHPTFARIYDVNIYDYHPKELADKYTGCEGKWYFFTPREPKYVNGKRPNRQTKDDGTWRASQRYEEVKNNSSNGGGVVGFKRSLAYFENRVNKTEWLMHEYTSPQNKMSEYVLCKIYKKETSETKKNRPAAIYQDKYTRKINNIQQDEKNVQDEPSPIRRRISGNSQLQQNNEPQQQQQVIQVDTTTNAEEDDGFNELEALLNEDDDDAGDEIDKNNSSTKVPVVEDEIAKSLTILFDKDDQFDDTTMLTEEEVQKLMAELEENEAEDNQIMAELDKLLTVPADNQDVSRISFPRSDCVQVFSLNELFSS